MALALLQVIIGAILGSQYRASDSQAHVATQELHRRLGVIQGFHYWGSSILILLGVILFTGAVLGKLRRAPYFACLGTLALSILFQITGNLLPFDRHGVQTATIESGIIGQIPALGEFFSRILVGDNRASAATLPHWYLFHRFVFPVGILILVAFGWNWVKAEKRAPRAAMVWVPVIVALVLGFGVPSPLGTGATIDDFGSFSASVSWYTMPLHALLTAAGRINSSLGWVGAIVVPGVLAGAFVYAGFVAPKQWWPQMLFLLVAAGAGWITWAFGGAPASLTGTRDPKDDSTKLRPPRGQGPTPQVDRTEAKQDVALARIGAGVFVDAGCFQCHGKSLEGTPAGPDLRKLFLKHSDAGYYERFIKDPKSVKPATMMPAFEDLSQPKLRALAEYLRFPQTQK